MYKFVKSEELAVGDVMKTIFMGHDSLIVGFKEYNGPLDFVDRIAVFAGGGRMSLQKDHPYEIMAEVDDWFKVQANNASGKAERR